MADQSAGSSSWQAAGSTQQRFEFYAVALTFTLLGLAVESATSWQVWGAMAELVGWCALLASGLAGLERLRKMPHVYKLHAVQAEKEGLGDGLKKAQLAGTASVRVLEDMTERPIEDLIRSAAESAQAVDKRVRKFDQDFKVLGRIQRWGFVLGLMMIAVARGARLILEAPAA